ncbi:MAG TPA: monofunctional biosynthetic peptidoglycan transglycosylase [Gemmatimonadaceae bacterium]|nr:monofunctional biosynthetic peptidoglycan transglycosylase [Gemmatimonadaceae bacterium]
MRHFLGRVVRGVALLVMLYYALCIAGLAYLRVFPPLITMVQIQRAVEAASEPGDYRRRATWHPLAELPSHVPRAVVAAEDARFWSHGGFDWEEVEAAQDAARRKRRAPRGASTITQQLVKNLFLTTHRSWVRKGVELALTPPAEMILPKRRILELYLNVAEWGPGVYGIEEAARHHYRVPAARLTREQAARLAAVLPAPRRRRPARMEAYAAVILDRMRSMGW